MIECSNDCNIALFKRSDFMELLDLYNTHIPFFFDNKALPRLPRASAVNLRSILPIVLHAFATLVCGDNFDLRDICASKQLWKIYQPIYILDPGWTYRQSMPLLPQILTPPRALHPFVLIQSSSAQSALPIVRALTRDACVNKTVLLFCLLYSPTTIADSDCLRSENVRVFDWTANIPGYADVYLDVREQIFDAIKPCKSCLLPIICRLTICSV